MIDIAYVIISVISGACYVWLFNKSDLFDDDYEEFFDFVMNNILRLLVFLLGFAWWVIWPVAAFLGVSWLFYERKQARKEKRRARMWWDARGGAKPTRSSFSDY